MKQAIPISNNCATAERQIEIARERKRPYTLETQGGVRVIVVATETEAIYQNMFGD
jgi:hypothetical protein